MTNLADVFANAMRAGFTIARTHAATRTEYDRGYPNVSIDWTAAEAALAECIAKAPQIEAPAAVPAMPVNRVPIPVTRTPISDAFRARRAGVPFEQARAARIAELDDTPSELEEDALETGAKELLRCAGTRFDAYKADPRNACVSHYELELRAIVATMLAELEGYVPK